MYNIALIFLIILGIYSIYTAAKLLVVLFQAKILIPYYLAKLILPTKARCDNCIHFIGNTEEGICTLKDDIYKDSSPCLKWKNRFSEEYRILNKTW